MVLKDLVILHQVCKLPSTWQQVMQAAVSLALLL